MCSDDMQTLRESILTLTAALEAHTAALTAHHQVPDQWGPLWEHPDADPVLSGDQAATYAGRHAKTLERAAKSGQLQYLQTREGGRIQYRLSHLNAWLDSLTAGRQATTKPRCRKQAPKVRPYGI